MPHPIAQPWYRWVILVVGVLAQAAACTFIYGLPTLMPALRAQDGLSLFSASLVISAPVAGLLLTLIAWGAAADRFGERVVMASGTALAAVFVAVTAFLHSTVLLCLFLALAGAAGASVNAASGRVVMGWFAVHERGLAMGARQTAQPLGVAIAAAVLPALAHHASVRAALLFPAIFCAVIAAAIALLVLDPPRGAAGADQHASSPYKERTIWQIHCASALLVVPQFAVSAFTVEYLVHQRAWNPIEAGRLVFVFQLLGACARIGSGVWSDAVSSRLRPMRQLAVASALLMLGLGLCSATGSALIVVVFGAAAVVTVSDNGLAYTAVAEIAGASWTGRALGVQNTGQNVASLLTAPVLAVIIGESRYALAFTLVALTPMLAIPLVPVRAERL